MSITQRELDKRLATPANATTSTEQQKLKSHQNQNLSDFATRASDIVSKMKNDAQNAQNAFKDCAEYFGEDPKIIDCSTFFGYFMRLISQFCNFPNSQLFPSFCLIFDFSIFPNFYFHLFIFYFSLIFFPFQVFSYFSDFHFSNLSNFHLCPIFNFSILSSFHLYPIFFPF